MLVPETSICSRPGPLSVREAEAREGFCVPHTRKLVGLASRARGEPKEMYLSNGMVQSSDDAQILQRSLPWPNLIRSPVNPF